MCRLQETVVSRATAAEASLRRSLHSTAGDGRATVPDCTLSAPGLRDNMRMNNRTPLAAMLVLASAIAFGLPPAEALDGQGRGRGPGKAQKADKADRKADRKAEKNDDRNRPIVVDRDSHRRVIREYGRGGSLPPGLAKRHSLPPGLRKQLRERGTLPPGLRKHLVLVEGPIVTRLPPVPAYYHRYFAGDDLIVVDTRTNRIVAILLDVWN